MKQVSVHFANASSCRHGHQEFGEIQLDSLEVGYKFSLKAYYEIILNSLLYNINIAKIAGGQLAIAWISLSGANNGEINYFWGKPD